MGSLFSLPILANLRLASNKIAANNRRFAGSWVYMNDTKFNILCELEKGDPLHLSSMTKEQQAAASTLSENNPVDIWVGGDLEITDQGLLTLHLEKEQRERADQADKRERKNRTKNSIKNIVSFVLEAFAKLFPFFFN